MQKPRVLHSIQRFITEGKRLPIYLGIFVTVFVLWLQIGAPTVVDDFIARLEYLIYDQRLSVMPHAPVPADNKIVIVDLDERSLQAEGQYPWNRIRVGRLVEKLKDNGALVVGFDITFPEPDRDIRDLLEPIDLDTLSSEFIQTLEIIEPQINSDRYFAEVMNGGIDVILAINFTQQTDATYNELPSSIVDIGAGLAATGNRAGYDWLHRQYQDPAGCSQGKWQYEPGARCRRHRQASATGNSLWFQPLSDAVSGNDQGLQFPRELRTRYPDLRPTGSGDGGSYGQRRGCLRDPHRWSRPGQCALRGRVVTE